MNARAETFHPANTERQRRDIRRILARAVAPGLRKRHLAAWPAAIAVLATPAQAANDTWTGATNNQWETSGNWSGGVPTASSDVIILTSSPYPFLANSSPTINSLLVDGAKDPNGGPLVANGKTLTVTTNAAIGVAGSTASQVIVDGMASNVPSTLTVGNLLTLGSLPGGYLIINHGARALLADALVGGGAGSGDRGFLYVLNGSSLGANDVYVGDDGPGTMQVTGGSMASLRSLTIGNAAATQGTVLVDGASSSLGTTAGIDVGLGGNGTLTIQNGGSVNARFFGIGTSAGSSGTINIDGTGSTMSSVLGSVVGASGTGVMNVTQGGTFSSSAFFEVGNHPGGAGTVNISGSGSKLTAGGVGNFVQFGSTAGATGALHISAGGVADFRGTDLTIFGSAAASGSNPAAQGTFSVDGAGSKLLANDLHLGNAGNAGAAVTNGGQVVMGGNYTLSLSGSLGSSSSLLIDGATSQVSAGHVVVGVGGAATLTIANGGILSTQQLTLGAQANSQGNLLIGAASNAPAAPAGILSANTITAGSGVGQIVFNHTGSFDLTSTVVGTAANLSLLQVAGITRLSGDGTAFSGIGQSLGGTLVVDGNYGVSPFAALGGTIGGSGTIGVLGMQSGGTLDPGPAGNTVGTLHVTGNASFAQGSIYKVDVTPAGQTDLLSVSGTTTISGGTVAATAAGGSYNPSTKYTILSSTGGVSGAFSSVTSNFAFLTPALSYDANNVYLTLTSASGNSNLFLGAANTPNQIATAGGVFSLGASNPVYNALLFSSTSWAGAALDQLSGDAHASFGAQVLADTPAVREGVNGRLRSAFESFAGANAMALAYDGMGNVARGRETPFAAWFQGFGNFNGSMSDGNAGSERHRLGGGIVGADSPFLIGDRLWRIGLAGAYASSSATVDSRNARASIDSYSATLYGGTEIGALGLRLGASAASHAFDARRTIAFPGVTDTLTAKYNARSYQIFGEAGYAWRWDRLWLEPFAGLAGVVLDRGAFTEAGTLAALTAQDKVARAAYTMLGLRALRRFGIITVDGSLAWRHGFGEVNAPTAVSFVSGGSPFTVSGVELRDLAVVSAGLRAELSSTASAGIGYYGQFGAHATDNGARADLSIRF